MRMRVMGTLVAVLLWVGIAFAEEPAPRDSEVEDTIFHLRLSSSGMGAPDNPGVIASRSIILKLPPAPLATVVRRLLESASPAGRIQGVRLARSQQIEALYPALREAIHDQANPVAAAAMKAVSGLVFPRHEVHPLRDDLLARLVEPLLTESVLRSLHALDLFADPVVVRTLLRLGPDKLFRDATSRVERVALLTQLSRAPSFRVRELAIRALANLPAADGEESGASIAILQGGVVDHSAAVRHACARALEFKLRRDSLHAALVLPLLEDSDPQVSAFAWQAVFRRVVAGTRLVSKRLLSLLEDGRVDTQFAAAMCLAYAPKDMDPVNRALAAKLKSAQEAWMQDALMLSLMTRDVVPAHARAVPFVVAVVEAVGVRSPYTWGRRQFWTLGTQNGGLASIRNVPLYSGSAEPLLALMGARVVPALVEEQGRAEERRRFTWLHALSHTGPAGEKAMDALTLDDQELVLERVRLQAMRKPPVTSVAPRLIADLRANPGDGSLTPTQDALIAMGADVVSQLLGAMAAAQEAPDGQARWVRAAEQVIERIGAPARSLVEQAAKHPKTGRYFKGLLERLSNER